MSHVIFALDLITIKLFDTRREFMVETLEHFINVCSHCHLFTNKKIK